MRRWALGESALPHAIVLLLRLLVSGKITANDVRAARVIAQYNLAYRHRARGLHNLSTTDKSAQLSSCRCLAVGLVIGRAIRMNEGAKH